MQSKVSEAADGLAGKPPIRKKREYKIIKETTMKENRIVLDNIGTPKTAFCKATEPHVEANPRALADKQAVALKKRMLQPAVETRVTKFISKAATTKKGKSVESQSPKIFKEKGENVVKPLSAKIVKLKKVDAVNILKAKDENVAQVKPARIAKLTQVKASKIDRGKDQNAAEKTPAKIVKPKQSVSPKVDKAKEAKTFKSKPLKVVKLKPNEAVKILEAKEQKVSEPKLVVTVKPKPAKAAKIIEAKTSKSKLVKIVKPKQTKASKIVKEKEAKSFKSKPERIVKPKAGKVTKPKVVKPPKLSKAEQAYNLLFQKFQTLTDQELAAEFVLNQYTWQKEPKEFWCTVCQRCYTTQYGLNFHLEGKHPLPLTATLGKSTSAKPPVAATGCITITPIEDLQKLE